MGEVYRARDTSLKREVALKVLPEEVSRDPDRQARFQREAELLAALNHPNIAAVYGLEQSPSATGIILELVEGDTLSDLIARGPLPLDDALAIAGQIADALEAAHERGVIHRDLKPANIKLTPNGTIKVLDFGLAKMLDASSGTGMSGGPGAFSPTMSPTLSVHATYAGVILGTAAYMSPEQARGRAVDKRTDIWAFGCLMFEMLTGARPFEGEDVAETIGAVIHKEPAWHRLPATTPPSMRTALQRCLEKDAKQRVRDIGDVRLLVTGAFESVVPSSAAASRSPTITRRLLVAAGAVGLAAAAAGAAWRFKPSVPRADIARFTVSPPGKLVLAVTSPTGRDVAISPDGTRVVYHVGDSPLTSQLLARDINQLDAVVLSGLTAPSSPFFSPDGRWMGYASQGDLRKVPIAGGPSISVCKYEGTLLGATWGPDDTIVFGTNSISSGLFTVSAGGGAPRMLTTAEASQGEIDHIFPSFLPGGRALLFTIVPTGGATLDDAAVGVLDLATGQKRVLIRGGGDAEYAESGHIVYAASGSLRAVRFDPARLEVIGDPVPVVGQVMTKTLGAAQFGLSKTGTLVYVPGSAVTEDAASRTLVWVDRRGREEMIKAPPRPYVYPRLSPDGTKIALEVRDREDDIWIWDFAHEALTRLTFDRASESYPVWTVDGRRLLFSSSRLGVLNVFAQQADNTGSAVQLTESRNGVVPNSVTPDGTYIAVRESISNSGGTDVMLVRLGAGVAATEPLLQSRFAEGNAEISPDGHWIAYQSNDSGRNEIYVRPFPNVNGGRWQISNAGGTRPTWARSGHELFFVAANSTALMAVAVQLAPQFSYGNPIALFDTSKYFLSGAVSNGRTYDVSGDGRRFLLVTNPDAGNSTTPTSATMTVVLNWFDELRLKVPVH